MNNIPASVLSIIQLHMKALLYWFSDEIYRRLLSLAQKHFLVQLKGHLDFAPLEEACADYHHARGPGAPPIHTVPRLVRVLLLKQILDLSLRQTEQAIQWNLLAKWFAGYALFETGPDHSTLERFEVWVYENHPRRFFDEVLSQIDRDFPQARQAPQIGDTFAMHANAAPESLIHLIRHTWQRLLTALEQADQAMLAQIMTQLDLEALFGPEDETKEFRLNPTQRSQRLHQTVAAAVQGRTLVQTHLTAHPGQPLQEVTNWLTILDKILTDELIIEQDEQGQVVSVQPLPKQKKGSYRIVSATDPDATYRVHGEQIDFGYNVNVAATTTFIREIRVDTGSQPDATAIPALLTAQQQHHNLTPAKFIYDQAAGTGKTHAQVEQATHGRTQLVAPLVDYGQRTQRFSPCDFVLSSDGASLTCPNGVVSDNAHRSNSAHGQLFRFFPSQCADCPLAQGCRGDKLPDDHMRRIFISDYRSALERARTYAQTQDFLDDLALRPIIERLIANLVRYHGARQARRRGQPKNDYQAKMNATAFNLRQWMRQLERQATAPAGT